MSSFKCNVCGKEYSRKQTLDIHFSEKHMAKHIQCHDCGKLFSSKINVRNHIIRIHLVQNNLDKCCANCKKFNTPNKSILAKHILNCGKQRKKKLMLDDDNVGGQFICALCPNACYCRVAIKQHYNLVHNIHFNYTTMEFNTRNEFDCWRNRVQQTTVARFVQYENCYNGAGKVKQYTHYICHRSGSVPPPSTHTRKRSQRMIGSKKINAVCPADIVARHCTITGRVYVRHQTTHVGHDQELAYMPVGDSVGDRLQLATLYNLGVPSANLVALLSASRGVDAAAATTAAKLVTTVDIRNWARKFVVDTRRHDHDDLNALLSIHNDDIAYCKLANEPVTTARYSRYLKKENFALVIMTAEQRRKFTLYGDGIIALDATYKVHQRNYVLHSLFVFDVNYVGYPAAFYLSDRDTTAAVSLFFDVIKDKYGGKECCRPRVLMSDMKPTYMNAWQSVMGNTPQHLYCTWHVYEAWRLNVRKLIGRAKRGTATTNNNKSCAKKDNSDTNNNNTNNNNTNNNNTNNNNTNNNNNNKSCAKRTMLDKLYKLGSTLDVGKFTTLLSEFRASGGGNNADDNDDSTRKFIRYFETTFCKTNEIPKWAFCYRRHCGINTNSSVESFHRILKRDYMGSRMAQSVAKLVNVLFKYLETRRNTDYVRRVRKHIYPKLRSLRLAHAESLTRASSFSVETESDECSWRVSVTTTAMPDTSGNGVSGENFQYVVTKKLPNDEHHAAASATTATLLDTAAEETCNLKCGPCGNACLHQYECSCLESAIKNNMCCHIHAVLQWRMTRDGINILAANNNHNQQDGINILAANNDQHYKKKPRNKCKGGYIKKQIRKTGGSANRVKKFV